MPGSLQARLALAIGLVVTLLCIGAATLTSGILRHEMDEVFDSALQETAQRILPLAVLDIFNREEEGIAQSVATLREHDEHFTYLVRDSQGRILLMSHAADPVVFPPYTGMGFRQTATHRLYYDAAIGESITIAMAEPIADRKWIIREIQWGLSLPLLLIIPLSLVAIFLVVRLSFKPVRQFRDDLASRGSHDLFPLAGEGLPNELAPVSRALNELLGRLDASFVAERSFAANAAHELRTPVAGAIAHAQRLRAETTDSQVANRADQIETALKRLGRLAEKLRQLARADGGRLKTGQPIDLRGILEATVAEFEHDKQATGLLDTTLPESPVLCDIDMDVFGILCRNLIENALKHGVPDAPVSIELTAGGRLTVTNDAPAVPPDILDRLTSRFERGTSSTDGSGLGLAIVRSIAEGADGILTLRSPVPGHSAGFEAVVDLPTASNRQERQHRNSAS